MSELFVCENADQCTQECGAKKYHERAEHCDPEYCTFGVVSKCVPVTPVPSIADEVKQGSREFSVEIGNMTIRAENPVEAVEKAARWLIANIANESLLVGDTSELNDLIHPGMSRNFVQLTNGKGAMEP